MKILGIVGSARKLGNTDILVKEALHAVQKEGAEISIIRLSDLHIEPCDGCMACVANREEGKRGHCRFKDDVEWFVELVESSDGLILGAPSYVGRPPGPFAMLEDRIAFLGIQGGSQKKSVTIGVAGGTHIAWWLIPRLNFIVRMLGFDLVGSFIAGSQGPGEVLLPERHVLVDEVNRLGRDLVFAYRGESDRLSDGAYKLRGWNWSSWGYGEEKLFTVEDCCPFCFSEAFTLLHGDFPPPNPREIVCAYCHNSVGHVFIENGRYVVRLDKVNDEEGMRQWLTDHMQDWVAASIPLFKEQAARVKPLRASYKDVMPWLMPPSKEKLSS